MRTGQSSDRSSRRFAGVIEGQRHLVGLGLARGEGVHMALAVHRRRAFKGILILKRLGHNPGSDCREIGNIFTRCILECDRAVRLQCSGVDILIRIRRSEGIGTLERRRGRIAESIEEIHLGSKARFGDGDIRPVRFSSVYNAHIQRRIIPECCTVFICFTTTGGAITILEEHILIGKIRDGICCLHQIDIRFPVQIRIIPVSGLIIRIECTGIVVSVAPIDRLSAKAPVIVSKLFEYYVQVRGICACRQFDMGRMVRYIRLLIRHKVEPFGIGIGGPGELNVIDGIATGSRFVVS